MKENAKKIREVLSWVLLFAMLGLLIFTIYHTYEARKNGESAFLFGYRPVLVLTGSMEPYMMTNSIALTKQVDSIDDLSLNDVVTYHVETDAGKMIRITHRIIALDDGTIYTKGDNNNVADGYPLTMDNIEAKVIGVCNLTAWIAQKWQTTAGKVMLLCIPAGLILLHYTWKLWRAGKREEQEEKEKEAASQEDSHHYFD